MKNLITSQRLKIISLVIPVVGLSFELLALFNPPSPPQWLQKILVSTGFVNFSFFHSSFFRYFHFGSGMSTNFLNVFFYSLMLAGGILLWWKQHKEIRLLRLCYSLLLIINTLYLLNSILSLALHPTIISQENFFLYVLIYLRILAVLYISWFALKVLNSMRTVEKIEDGTLQVTVPASRWHRFFHFIVDTILAVLVFAPYFSLYAGDFLGRLSQGMGERPVLFLILLASRMLYYPFFEALFGATPAKMFAETRVVNRRSEAISLDQSIFRTLSRFVPFEPFSFLGDTGGWHDRWTDTSVVKEVREGVRGIRYFLVIPVVLVLGGIGYTAHNMYENHRSKLAREKEHQQKVETLELGLNNLTTNTIIKVQSSRYETIYLKPEDIDKDDIYCSVFDPENGSLSPYAAGEYYKKNQYSLNKVMVNRRQLMASYEKEYGVRLMDQKSLLGDDKTYEVEEVFDLDLPLIRSRGTGSMGMNSISLAIENCGWGGVLKDVKNIEGSATFTCESPLPYEIRPSYGNSFSCFSFSFYSTNHERGEPYSFQFTVTDQYGNDHVYEVHGVDMQRTLKEISTPTPVDEKLTVDER